jgi:hypothetical protein
MRRGRSAAGAKADQLVGGHRPAADIDGKLREALGAPTWQ